MKKLLLMFALAGTLAFSQTQVAPIVNPHIQLFNAGVPCSGCLLSTFSAGTSTPLVTYSESTGTTPNANPIQLDASGQAVIYLTSASYKFVLKTAAGVSIWTQDNISWATPLTTFSGITSTANSVIKPATAATSGANQSSPTLCLDGFYFNISSLTDQWCLQTVLGTGTAPTSTFTVTHSGSGGAATTSIPGNVSVGGTLCPTGNLDSHTIYAACQSGADFGAKVNAAVALAVAGDTVDARGFNTNQTVSTIPAISKSVRLLLPGVTLTCAMADPGTASGCFNVTADGVTIDGIKGQTAITQGNSALIQTAIYFGSHKNSTIRGIKMNWNEANNAKTTQFYTGIRSAGGSADIRIENNEFTATGDRSLDIRGANRVWIINNYFHQTGTNVGGTGGNGSAISVSVDGTTISTDCWIENNVIEEWGDTALSCDHCARAHIIGNTARGRLDFSNSPSSIESGIDVVGTTDSEVIGNHVINVQLFNLDAETQQVGGVTYVPTNVRVIGNEFRHNLGAFDPSVNVSASLINGQPFNFTFEGNTFNGVRLNVSDTDGAIISGNTFRDMGTSVQNTVLTIKQSGLGGIMKNFNIFGNTFQTTNASITLAILVGSTVTTPGASSIGPNNISAAITTAVNNTGAASIPIITKEAYQAVKNSSDTIAPLSSLLKSRGTPDAPTAVATGDILGQFGMYGFDGTIYIQAGTFKCNVQGTVAANQVPTRCDLQATSPGGTLTTLFRLLGDQLQLETFGTMFPSANGGGLGIAGNRYAPFFTATNSDSYQTSTNCAAVGTAASPSVASCVAAAAGQFSCATNATGATCQVNTTAVTANSEIIVQESDTAVTGTRLGVTCNTGTNVLPASRLLASSVAGASFTINLGTVTTNPACFSYSIIN